MNLFWDEPAKPTRTPVRTATRPTVGGTTLFEPKGMITPNYESNWVPPTEFIPIEGVTAIDWETRDTTLTTVGSAWAFPTADDYPIGVAVASCGRSAYYAIRHPEGNFDGDVIAWLREQLGRSNVQMVAANSLYDLGWCNRMGIRPYNGAVDVQGLAALLDENRLSYSLDNLSKDILGVGKDDSLLQKVAGGYGVKNIYDNLWRLPAKYVGPYAEMDATLALRLYDFFKPQIAQQGLKELADLERDVITVCVAMRMRGVRVDLDAAEQARIKLQNKELDCIRRIQNATGVLVSAWENETIARACVQAGISLPRTKTDKPSVQKNWLEENATQSSVIGDILELRRYNKARTTFIDGHVFRHVKNGRIHPEFHPLRREDDDGSGYGTVTGRFSSSNPNFQQLPSRDEEIKKLVRCLMLPEEGELWHNADYSSQEPRLSLHYASILRLRGAAEAVKIFNENPRTDYHGMCAKWMGGISRQHAKTIFLGITYGMGGAKLCHELGLPTTHKVINGRTVEVAGTEGQALLDRFYERVPFVQPLARDAQTMVKQLGYITTIYNRRCRFPMRGGEYMFLNKALNRRIQGSAADQTKQAMVNCYRAGHLPLITEHDALGFSVTSERVAREQASIMEDCVQLEIPVVVDSKVAATWGDSK
jgi:DNA polymerase I-like protein with 3'-5' exonuclease and polymerase domains